MDIQLSIPAYWHRSSNFGDQLTPYLIEKITGRPVVYVPQPNTFEEKTDPVLMVTGSILSSYVHCGVIWGNGYAWSNEDVHKPLEIAAVRGPYTRKKLIDKGIDCPEVYGDPALLLPFLYDQGQKPQHELGIIPHMIDHAEVSSQYGDQLQKMNAIIIDLTWPIEKVIDHILMCKKTISSSLHGLIVSHAYGIPSKWVKFSDKVIGDDFKFHDYLKSVGMHMHGSLDMRSKTDLNSIMGLITEYKTRIDLRKLYDSCPVLHLRK
jgi:pyruvyltransferase